MRIVNPCKIVVSIMLGVLFGTLHVQAYAQADPTTPHVAEGVAPIVYYHHQDATGNLVARSDEAGQVVWRADVRLFGEGVAEPMDDPMHFLDQPRLTHIGDEDGLYQLGARFYDPLTGRFLSPDPLRLTEVELTEPQRFNPYAYALNNPLRYTDPSGFTPLPSLEDATAILERWAKSADLSQTTRELAADLASKATTSPTSTRQRALNQAIRIAAANGRVSVGALEDTLRNLANRSLIRPRSSQFHPSARKTVVESRAKILRRLGRLMIVLAVYQIADATLNGNYAEAAEATANLTPATGLVYWVTTETYSALTGLDSHVRHTQHCWPNCQDVLVPIEALGFE